MRSLYVVASAAAVAPSAVRADDATVEAPALPSYVRKIALGDPIARGVRVVVELDRPALLAVGAQRLNDELRKHQLLDTLPWGNFRFEGLVAAVDGIDVASGPDDRTLAVTVRGHIEADRKKLKLRLRGPYWADDGRKTIADVTVAGTVAIRPAGDARLAGKALAIEVASTAARIDFQLTPARGAVEVPLPIVWRREDLGLGDHVASVPLIGQMSIGDLRVRVMDAETIEVVVDLVRPAPTAP